MPGRTYKIANFAMVTTAAPVAVGLVAATIKTLLQVQVSAATPLLIVEWGIDFDASALAAPVKVELIDTFAIAATVTAHVAAGVQPFSDPGAPALDVVLGVSATGFSASAEGTITQTRSLDTHLIDPVNNWAWQWPEGREPQVPVSRNLRIRANSPGAVNALCYVIVGPQGA